MGDSMLNFTEILRRIGVKNRTGVDLSETVRMTVAAGDLSHLVPPVAVPVAGARASVAALAAAHAQFTLQCNAAGGCFVIAATDDGPNMFHMWITAASPFGALTSVAAENFAFGQQARSVFAGVTVAGASVAPAASPGARALTFPQISLVPIFVGPGQFFNLEHDTANAAIELSLFWQEIPAVQRLP